MSSSTFIKRSISFTEYEEYQKQKQDLEQNENGKNQVKLAKDLLHRHLDKIYRAALAISTTPKKQKISTTDLSELRKVIESLFNLCKNQDVINSSLGNAFDSISDREKILLSILIEHFFPDFREKFNENQLMRQLNSVQNPAVRDEIYTRFKQCDASKFSQDKVTELVIFVKEVRKSVSKLGGALFEEVKFEQEQERLSTPKMTPSLARELTRKTTPPLADDYADHPEFLRKLSYSKFSITVTREFTGKTAPDDQLKDGLTPSIIPSFTRKGSSH